MSRVLLIGNGAREHVIAESLKKARSQVFSFGRKANPGLVELSEEFQEGDYLDFDLVRKYVREINPDFAVIGPDNPIGEGLADSLLEIGVRSVAPLKTAARLESSKAFTRGLLGKYNIAGNPKYKVFYSEQGIEGFLKELGDEYVIKANGLMSGKGVKLSGEHLADDTEALNYAKECLLECGSVVIEEKMVGEEFSAMFFVDKKSVIKMPLSQDHKRAGVGDSGSNTGGMGSYSCRNHLLPFLDKFDLIKAREMTRSVLKALKEEAGVNFKGIIYGNFMATADGVKLIEYNARFADPETINLLPLLQTNFEDLCWAIINDDLDRLDIGFRQKATVCKYVVPAGYPDAPAKGEIISVNKLPEGVQMYYGDVVAVRDGLRLGLSRALAFLGIGKNLEEAEKIAEEGCRAVQGQVFHREDIGTKAMIEQKIAKMKMIRQS